MNKDNLYRDVLADALKRESVLLEQKALLMTACHMAAVALELAGARSAATSIRTTLDTIERHDAQRLTDLDKEAQALREAGSDSTPAPGSAGSATGSPAEAPVGATKGAGITGQFSALFKR